jgi:hypothetical protein
MSTLEKVAATKLAVVLWYAITSIAAGNHAAASSNTLMDKFLSHAPVAWQQYCHQLAAGTMGTSVTKVYDTSKARALRSVVNGRLVIGPDVALLDYQPQFPANQPAEARGVNNRYAFVVNRPSNNNPWRLLRVGSPNNRGLSVDRAPIDETVTRELCLHLMLWNEWLPDLTRRKQLRLTEAHRIGQNDDAKVKCVFRCDDEVSKKTSPVRHGWLIVDPANYWLIEEMFVYLDGPAGKGTHSQKHWFRMTPTGFPVVERVLRQDANADGRTTAEFETRYDLRMSAPSSGDVSLAHYGLPEPPLHRRTSYSEMMLWLSASVCALFLWLCVWVKWRRRRS